MPTLLFRLNGVPDDEADEVRELLTSHQIDFYETDAGRWGFSVAAIWVEGEEQLDTARRLIEEYQTGRALRVRTEYEALRREGRHETFADRFMRDPVRVILYALVIAGVLYVSLLPYLQLSS